MPQGLLGGLLMGMGQAKRDKLEREREKELLDLKKTSMKNQDLLAKIQLEEAQRKSKLMDFFMQRMGQGQEQPTPAPQDQGADKSKLVEALTSKTVGYDDVMGKVFNPYDKRKGKQYITNDQYIYDPSSGFLYRNDNWGFTKSGGVMGIGPPVDSGLDHMPKGSGIMPLQENVTASGNAPIGNELDWESEYRKGLAALGVGGATPGQPGMAQGGGLPLSSMSPEEMAIMKWATGMDVLGAGNLAQRQKDTALSEKRYNLDVDRFNRGFSEGVPITVEGPGGSQSVMRVPKFGSIGSIQTKPAEKDQPISPQDSPLWIHPETSERAPVGMTPAEAMQGGFKKVTSGQIDSFKSFGAAESIIGEVESLMGQVFPKTESLMGRVTGGAKRKFGQVLQTDPKAAQLYSLIQGTLAPVVRSMGEKGNLSDLDMKRAINLFPELTDDADVAWGKVKQLKNLLDTLKQKAVGGMKEMPEIKSKAEYDKLPPGSQYIWNNIRYTKGQ